MQPSRLAVTDLACRRGDRVLFRGLSFVLEQGEALQVTGPNGTGKSSLLRILAGLRRPLSGTVESKGGVSLLDERLALDEHLPLGRALDVWRRIDRRWMGPEELKYRGLDHLLDVPVRYLSTGQRKRAAILLSSRFTGIWLLDEPLNGLDKQAAQDLQEEVAAHRSHGGVAVIASHQPFEADGLRQLELAEFAA